MIANPLVVTVSGVAISMPRIGQGPLPMSSIYQNSDATYKYLNSHKDNGRRMRSLARLDNNRVGTDPLNPATYKPYSASSQFILDVPIVGYTGAEIEAMARGHLAQLAAGTFLTDFIGEQS